VDAHGLLFVTSSHMPQQYFSAIH